MIKDNRLDFISNIKDEHIKKMTSIREMYIALDGLLDLQESNNNNQSSIERCKALARTHLEISLQFAIKTLCLCGEIKNGS